MASPAPRTRGKPGGFDRGLLPGRVKDFVHTLDQRFELILEWFFEGIEPLNRGQDVFELVVGVDLFDAQGNEDFRLCVSKVQFFFDLIASVGIGGMNQDHDARGLDTINDEVVPRQAGGDVAGRDPAANSVPEPGTLFPQPSRPWTSS
jgi:hypothetical protein